MSVNRHEKQNISKGQKEEEEGGGQKDMVFFL
jgi:hypothetical protein